MKQIIKWTQLVALLFGGILVSGLSLLPPVCNCFFPATLIEIPSQTLDETDSEKVLNVTLTTFDGLDSSPLDSCFIDLYLTVHNPSDTELTLDIFMLDTNEPSNDGGFSEMLNEADAGNRNGMATPNLIEIYSLSLQPGDTFDGNPLDESETPLQLATGYGDPDSQRRRQPSEIGVSAVCKNSPNKQFIFSTQPQGDQQLEISGSLVYGNTSDGYIRVLCNCKYPTSSSGSGPSCCVDTQEPPAAEEGVGEVGDEAVTDAKIKAVFNREVTADWE